MVIFRDFMGGIVVLFDILKPEKSRNFIFQNPGSGFEFNPGIKYIFKLYNKYYLYIYIGT